MNKVREVVDYLKKAGTFYLATVEGDQPRVRPFGAVVEFEDKLYIFAGAHKPCVQQMAANPKVEISATIDGDWIRIAATVVPDNRPEAVRAILNAYPTLRGMYKEDDGSGAPYYLKDATASFNSFTKEPKTIKF